MKVIAAVLGLCFAPFAVAAQGISTPTATQKPTQVVPAQQPAPATSTPSPMPASVPKIDPAKETAIRKLLDTSGVGKMAQQSMESMAATIRPLLRSSLPAGEYREKLIELFFQKFQSNFGQQQLFDMAVPIYDKYFTMEEIDDLAQFYKTPLGQKTLHVMPTLLSELQAGGKQLGEKIGRDSMLEVLDEHPELKKALDDAGAAAQKP